MDTDWFGVDDRGRVAIFDTGETGAAPVGTQEEYLSTDSLLGSWRQGDVGIPVDDLPRGPRATVWQQDLQWHWRRLAKRGLTELRGSYCDYSIVQLADAAAIGSAPAHRINTAGVFFLSRDFTTRNLIDWRREGVLEQAWINIDEKRLCGLFIYDVFPRYPESYPYVRLHTPPEPLLESRLPNDIRKKLVRLRGADFSIDGVLQPAEFVDCYAWAVDWYDALGDHHEFGND
jgi:hypothetical protein